jgi:hypothetical protein
MTYLGFHYQTKTHIEMKKLLTLMLAATLVFAASESSFAQKKKKKAKKGKVTAHGEKSVKGGKFNERKNIDPSAGPAGSAGSTKKKKKGKKSKNTSFAPLKHQFDLFYTYAKKEGNEIV